MCNDAVSCGGADPGTMSPRECCLEDAAGLSYAVPGQEICINCVGECGRVWLCVHDAPKLVSVQLIPFLHMISNSLWVFPRHIHWTRAGT